VERFAKSNDSRVNIGIGALGTQNGNLTPNFVRLGWVEGEIHIAELLQHKYLLALEGSDVSTELKWTLMSNSVVFRPAPKRESWLLERNLVPWVHFIPVHPSGSDLIEQLNWAISHPQLCRSISEASTRYAMTLLNFTHELQLSARAAKT
jgi:hypothetical protein